MRWESLSSPLPHSSNSLYGPSHSLGKGATCFLVVLFCSELLQFVIHSTNIY